MTISVGRILAYDAEGTKHIFQFDDVKKAESLLEKISDGAPGMAAGFTPANREKFREIMIQNGSTC